MGGVANRGRSSVLPGAHDAGPTRLREANLYQSALGVKVDLGLEVWVFQVGCYQFDSMPPPELGSAARRLHQNHFSAGHPPRGRWASPLMH